MKVFNLYISWLVFISLQFSDTCANCVIKNIEHDGYEYEQYDEQIGEINCYFQSLYKPNNFLLKARTQNTESQYGYYHNINYVTDVIIKSSYIPSIDYETFNVEVENVNNLEIVSSEVVNITDLTKFPNLKSLNLCYNNLTHLYDTNFISQTNMHTLNLSHNYIEEIEQKTFKNNVLHELDLSHNRLIFLNNIFNGCVLLENVYLSHNNISINVSDGSPFRFLLNLRRLDLSNNYLATLNSTLFWNNSFLTVLDLSGNLLKKLPAHTFRTLNGLTNLNLARNKIEFIDFWFLAGLKSLEILNLNGNKIANLDINAFHHVPKLSSLFINNNHINDIDVEKLLTFTELKLIAIQGNDLDCIKIINIISILRKKRVEVQEGTDIHNYTVHGIKCGYNSSEARGSEAVNVTRSELETFISSNHSDVPVKYPNEELDVLLKKVLKEMENISNHSDVPVKYPNEEMDILLKKIIQDMENISKQIDSVKNISDLNDLLKQQLILDTKKVEMISAAQVNQSLDEYSHKNEKLHLIFGTITLILLLVVIILIAVIYKVINYKTFRDYKEVQPIVLDNY